MCSLKYYILIYCYVSSFSNGYSQSYSNLNPTKWPSQYIIKTWNTENGLSSESTNDLIIGPKGYLWISSFTGLHRFDGNKFTVYNAQNSNLPSPNVLCLAMDKQGTLWLGSLHGISLYRNGNFENPKEFSAINKIAVEALLTSENGDIWLSTKSNRLYVFKQNQLTEVTDLFDVNSSLVLSLAEGEDGTIFIGTDNSELILYKDKVVKKIIFDTKVNGVNRIVSSTGGKVFIATGKGLYTYKQGKIEKTPALENRVINSLVEDQNGILWLGTLKGLFRFNTHTNQLDSLTETQGLPNNFIRDLLFDAQGNLWGGTYRNGIFMLADGPFSSYTKNDGLSSDNITGIAEIDKSTLLMGDEDGNLNLLKSGSIQKYLPSIPIPQLRLKHIFIDRKSRIWISTYGGLVLLDGKRSKTYKLENGFPDDYIRQVFEDSEGNIWIGTKNAGLIKLLTDNTWELFDMDRGMSSNYIMSIAENNRKQIIVGTLSGINVLEDAKVIDKINIDDGLPSNFSFQTFSTDKILWIAGNDGLTAYSKDFTYTFNSSNGLPSNIVYNILADNYGNLWLPSEQSILKVRLSELESIAESGGGSFEVQQFNKSHGMKNNHCLGAVHSYKDSKGDLWIPTQGGVVHIRPTESFKQSLDTIILFESIYADHDIISAENPVIPASADRLSITFTSIDFKNIDLLQFMYKLEPFDNEWITSSNERTAIYTNLSPGDYTFLLRTSIKGSKEGITKSLHIQIKAAWYQTIWAKLFYVLAVSCLGLLIYYIRLKTLASKNKQLESLVKHRTLEIENQKEELRAALKNLSEAREQMIHSEKMASLGILAAGVAHEINNPLNFIQGGLYGIEDVISDKNNLSDDEDFLTSLNAIREGVNRATSIVSSLNEFNHQREDSLEQCSLHHIIDNCLIMLHHLVKGRITIVKNFSEKELVVYASNGKLHQVFLNILTNAIHAIKDKGTITVNTSLENKRAIVQIADTGIGIDKNILSRITEPFFTTKDPGKGTGLGLAITYNIIKELDGTLQFDSEFEKGTIATVILPCAE